MGRREDDEGKYITVRLILVLFVTLLILFAGWFLTLVTISQQQERAKVDQLIERVTILEAKCKETWRGRD